MAKAQSSISSADLVARIERGDAPAILDVRTRAEFDRGHVPGAVNIPFTQIGQRAAEVPGSRDQELVVYCGHGPRAYIAAAVLRRLGWKNIRYLSGHWAKWKGHHEAAKK